MQHELVVVRNVGRAEIKIDYSNILRTAAKFKSSRRRKMFNILYYDDDDDGDAN